MKIDANTRLKERAQVESTSRNPSLCTIYNEWRRLFENLLRDGWVRKDGRKPDTNP